MAENGDLSFRKAIRNIKTPISDRKAPIINIDRAKRDCQSWIKPQTIAIELQRVMFTNSQQPGFVTAVVIVQILTNDPVPHSVIGRSASPDIGTGPKTGLKLTTQTVNLATEANPHRVKATPLVIVQTRSLHPALRQVKDARGD